MRVQFGDVQFKFNNYGYSHGATSANNQLIRETLSSMMQTVRQHTQQEIVWEPETVPNSTESFYRIAPKFPKKIKLQKFNTVIRKFMQDFSKTNNRIQEVTVIKPKPFAAEA